MRSTPLQRHKINTVQENPPIEPNQWCCFHCKKVLKDEKRDKTPYSHGIFNEGYWPIDCLNITVFLPKEVEYTAQTWITYEISEVFVCNVDCMQKAQDLYVKKDSHLKA